MSRSDIVKDVEGRIDKLIIYRNTRYDVSGRKLSSYKRGGSDMAEEKKKTTMSVAEMRELLGLGKTDSYWLIHKKCFETVLVNGKMRINIESFEKWYANQVKHKKVDGPPPGEELRARSYSPQELAELLQVDDSEVYDFIHRDKIPTFLVDTWMRVSKEDFEKWYASQSKYRIPEDRERDRAVEEATISMPEAARELGITRGHLYSILNAKKNRGRFEIVIIAGRKRITKESFETWYESQDRYLKFRDWPKEEQEAFLRRKKMAKTKRLIIDLDKPSYSPQEAAELMSISQKEVYGLIRDGDLIAASFGRKYRIRRENIEWWIEQHKKNTETEG